MLNMIGLGLGIWQSSVTGFNPLSLSPALWLDASDSATLFQSNGGAAASADGDPVGYILDKSGNGRHLTQVSGTNKPTLKTAIKNSKNIIRFDGVDDYIATSSFTVSQPDTVFIVFKMSSTTTPQYIYSGTSYPAGQSLVRRSTGFFAYEAGGGNAVNSTAPNNVVWNLFCTIYNGQTTKIYLNTVEKTGTNTASLPGSGAINLFGLANLAGYSAYANFDLAEAIVISGAISNANRALVDSYLNFKWGVY
jgi:hypothetical protein